MTGELTIVFGTNGCDKDVVGISGKEDKVDVDEPVRLRTGTNAVVVVVRGTTGKVTVTTGVNTVDVTTVPVVSTGSKLPTIAELPETSVAFGTTVAMGNDVVEVTIVVVTRGAEVGIVVGIRLAIGRVVVDTGVVWLDEEPGKEVALDSTAAALRYFIWALAARMKSWFAKA